jgi:hypothetical protein
MKEYFILLILIIIGVILADTIQYFVKAALGIGENSLQQRQQMLPPSPPPQKPEIKNPEPTDSNKPKPLMKSSESFKEKREPQPSPTPMMTTSKKNKRT